MKKPIQELQQNINDIKQATDTMKTEIQSTVELAKQSANQIKHVFGELRESREGLSASMEEGKANVNELRQQTRSDMRELRETFQTDEPASADAKAERFELVKEGNGFVIYGREGLVGEITYTPIDEHTWAADHTYVTPEYRGRDIAQRLLQRLASAARLEHKKIVPACSYVEAQFRRNVEYADVWQR